MKKTILLLAFTLILLSFVCLFAGRTNYRALAHCYKAAKSRNTLNRRRCLGYRTRRVRKSCLIKAKRLYRRALRRCDLKYR